MRKNKTKKLLISAFLTCVMILSSIAVMPALTVLAAPEAPGVYLYQDADYNGDWIRIDPNNNVYDSKGYRLGTSETAISDYFNDRISSILIVGNYQITLYENWLCHYHDYSDGKTCLFNGSSRNIGNYDMNDCVSSAYVEPLNAIGIYVYTGLNCTGRCFKFNNDCVQLSKYGFDNQISSIKFIGNQYHTGAYVELYANTGYQGHLGNSTFNVKQSGNWTQYTNLAKANDVVSSLRPHIS